jgi:type VI secretion system protein ImpF
MSGSRQEEHRARASLLDRLLDWEPEQAVDRPVSPAQSLAALRRSVQRDLEALLNTRRRWRSWPAHLDHLAVSSVGYGIPDFASGVLNDPVQRNRLCQEIETAIRRYEPRFAHLRVMTIDNSNPLEPRLRLRIEALLRAEAADEPVAFETVIDTAAATVTVRDHGERPDV